MGAIDTLSVDIVPISVDKISKPCRHPSISYRPRSGRYQSTPWYRHGIDIMSIGTDMVSTSCRYVSTWYRRNADTMSIPCRYHVDTMSIPCRYHADTMSIPYRHRRFAATGAAVFLKVSICTSTRAPFSKRKELQKEIERVNMTREIIFSKWSLSFGQEHNCSPQPAQGTGHSTFLGFGEDFLPPFRT